MTFSSPAVEFALGMLIFFFSISAYYQLDRKMFLITNSFAILFIGISFYIHHGFVGVYVESMMLAIHLSALFISDKSERVLKLFAPPVAFILLLWVNDNGYGILMAIAVSFFVLGVYQKDMGYNKLSFIFGLFFLCLYSFSMGSYYVAFTNIIGIGILYYRYLIIRGFRSDKISLGSIS